jgi:hypothetical protein
MTPPRRLTARALVTLLAVGAGALLLVSSAQADFAFLPGTEGFSVSALNQDSTTVTQAGSHPYQVTVGFTLTSHVLEGRTLPEGDIKRLTAALPKGLVVDPQATPRCTEAQLESDLTGKGCPPSAAVGTIAVTSNFQNTLVTFHSPLFNMMPPPGEPAEFGVDVGALAVYFHLAGGVGGAPDYTLFADASDIISKLPVIAASTTLWGDPSSPSHDAERCPLEGFCNAPVERTRAAFLTMPTACAGPLSATISAASWQEPGAEIADTAELPGLEGCGALAFTPSIAVQPETGVADSPTGLQVDLHFPQNEEYESERQVPQLAEAHLRDAVVTLPAGMAVNPSSAEGLAACTPEQFGLTGPDATKPVECPDASKLGTVEIDTPLLDHPLPGAVYLAAQGDNPFHSLLAIYVAVDDPATGVIVKLAGHVQPNAETGQLTTTFEENPQLPFDELKFHFFGGPRAPLTTPSTCGTKTTSTDLTPWTSPEGEQAHPSSSFKVISGPGGSACAETSAEASDHPSFSAGTVSIQAGAFSPFVLKLSREDGSQELKALNVTLPPGLIGKLAGVAECPQGDVEAAERRSGEGEGRTEQQSPSCPASSEVGTVNVGVGSGSPFYVQGHAYLTGPYKGAPFGIAIITPAIAGPFDLGTVVVRSALYVNPETAQVTVKSDEIPHILDGIPLDVRSIAVNVSRSDFTFNPTSCDPMAISGEAFSTVGQATGLTDPFQVGGCTSLPFKPSFTVSTQAKTSKADGAGLIVKVAQKQGEANIHKVELTIPKVLPSRLSTLQQACSEAQFNANPAGCPEASFIGTAIAHTPVLNVPLTGPAILVSHGSAEFPDVEFLLQGEGVEIVLDGKTDIKGGVTYSKFETVPDAPISSFETILPEGPHSVLTTERPESTNLCAQKPLTLPVAFTAQNGTEVRQGSPIAVEGCSTSLSFVSSVKKQTLTLTVYAPAAGRLTASGKGLTTVSKTAKGHEDVAITLKQKHAGKFKSFVKVVFSPSTGKIRSKQSKSAKVMFKK